MYGRPVLTQAQLQAYVPQLSTQDIIWNPLYDSNTYSGSAGQLQLTYYALPQGQGTTTAPGATGAKTIADTNLQSASQLTLGNAFYMTGQEILFYPGENPEGNQAVAAVNNFLNDTYVFSKNGTLTLTVGSNRIYLQDGPLAMFPPATRIAMAAALAGWATTAFSGVEISYGVMAGEVYSIVPIYLQANLQFNETLTWQAAQALPSANNARVFLRMRGYLNRNAQ